MLYIQLKNNNNTAKPTYKQLGYKQSPGKRNFFELTWLATSLKHGPFKEDKQLRY